MAGNRKKWLAALQNAAHMPSLNKNLTNPKTKKNYRSFCVVVLVLKFFFAEDRKISCFVHEFRELLNE